MMTHADLLGGAWVAGEMSVEDLARVARTGDSRALDMLLRQIHPAVLRRCAGLLPYRQEAEEACQDAMLQVARRIDTFEGRAMFTTWLYPIVTNCVRQTYRSLKRRSVEQSQSQSQSPVQTEDHRRTSVIAGARVDVLEAVERLEARRPELVEPFLLRDLADLEYSEISRRLGLPITTLKFRIHEARKFVRDHLSAS
jgi:RNA polymerase sigma-70 factor (ECF subfamily)